MSVDFSAIIDNFLTAELGEEVRGSLVAIAESLQAAINSQLNTVTTDLTDSNPNAAAQAKTVGETIATVRDLIYGGTDHAGKYPVIESFIDTSSATEANPYDVSTIPGNGIIYNYRKNISGFDEGGIFSDCPVEFGANDILRIERILLRPDLVSLTASLYLVTTPFEQLVCWRTGNGTNYWTKYPSQSEIEGLVQRFNYRIDAISEKTQNLLSLDDVKPWNTNVEVSVVRANLYVRSTESGSYSRAYVDLQLDPGTYYVSGVKTVLSGSAGVFYIESTDGSSYPVPWQTLIGYSAEDGVRHSAPFTTTTGFIRLGFFCTGETAEIGNVAFSELVVSAGEPLPYMPPETAVDYIARLNSAPRLNRTTANIFKRVVCVGDSYTEGWINIGSGGAAYKPYSWVNYMSQRTGNDWVNCGVSGATTQTWLSGRGLTEAQAAGRAQAYVIGLMINDADTGLPVGTIADIESETPTTYYGCLAKIIRELNAISPQAKIFVNTCPKSWASMPPYQQAVRDVVSAYENTYPVHLIDLKARQDLYSAPSFTSDATYAHYTAIGYEQMAEIYEYVLSDYINTHVSAFQNVHEIPYDG